MNVAVVGSRVGVTREFVWEKLDGLVKEGWITKDAEIISGGAFGVDSWAAEWAAKCGLSFLVFKPKSFDRLGLLKRNAEIVEASDKLVAFKGLESKTKGTDYTYALALKKGIPCKIFHYPNSEAFE